MNKLDILQDAMAIALQLEKRGHHLFVSYSPHINGFNALLYLDGWNEDKSPDGMWRMSFDTRGYEPDYKPMSPQERWSQINTEIWEACNVELAHE